MALRSLLLITALAALASSVSAFAESYTFPASNGQSSPVITLNSNSALNEVQRTNIEALVKDTYFSLDRNNIHGVLYALNQGENTPLPNWLYNAIERCEKWFHKTEGNVSCRNGALYDYWRDYSHGKSTGQGTNPIPSIKNNKTTQPLSRREVRRLARVARIADVHFKKENTIEFSAPIQWDLSAFASALVIERIADFLASAGFANFHISVDTLQTHVSSSDVIWQSKIDGDAIGFSNATLAHLKPWQQPAYSDRYVTSQEKGLISHSDGWPNARFEVIALASTAFDAALLSHFGATKPAQQSLDLVNSQPSLALKLVDANGRVFTSDTFASRTAVNDETGTASNGILIDVALPMFDIADYRGPYVSVWISDDKNRLVKSLALRGTSERWLSELRTWWRRVGRKEAGRNSESLIDGFSGATKKNTPLHIAWDGLDDYGNTVIDKPLVLHVEVAREHGGRSYEKVSFAIDGLTQPIEVKGDNEIASIKLSAKGASQ
ncbi:hypothetical protein KUL42_29760 [Alteromonas sp. KUL42]|uniref:DUF2271 domain-containing protein n=1 Tax=Alteromonas sp. KUL42 TaxID=2480797 RepID=UPI001035FEA8|nr:DUF2271 domain-containing protein [Alteromonas sp. KUL42]TAP33710.1 DUF2271 domain-containing protein [Alteromonas sp. KUL42]GEA08215.1 hypothetical protein KUL42_29760 [Alteromonas sp. KUL42]